ncbi:putative nuclease HARBI1 [Gigantopelta aegis]|uniref:putative nuclease HARBI1 n=1 Tax=Gigantopelta aegis TaxID=1735272 RepID=UPI001B88BF04|nr:putative nuclease HARBI1 [Gigantopelta aegis]
MEDQQSFFNFLRMPPEMFNELLNRVGPRCHKIDTRYRKALESGLKLAVTIWHLASGDKYPTLQYDFRVARNTISMFIPEVCQAIVEEYKDEVTPCPTTPDGWRTVADEFQRKGNVPHACGALDGKHVAIRCPANTRSLYQNYKGFFSVVLLALVDANYKFLWLDIGGYGSMSDSQIYNASEMKECLEDGTIEFPRSRFHA